VALLDEFWKAAAGKLAERWASIAAPAVVFWAAALLAWSYAGPGWSRLEVISDWLNKQKPMALLATLVGALVVIATSTIVVQRLASPVLRLLEGYWPCPFHRLAESFRRRAELRKAEDKAAWDLLQAAIEENEPTAQQRVKLAHLERRRRYLPVKDSELLPTRIGNILRASETRPRHRYGLDLVMVWPRLWLVLPDAARQELASARRSLDASVAAAVWGAAFLAFIPLTWWALVGLVVSVASVLVWVPARAEVFADLTEASVELYRTSLYRHLRWPVPKNAAVERECGEALTKYLVRGSDQPYPNFTPPTETKA
jgi:hypothetical protein